MIEGNELLSREIDYFLAGCLENSRLFSVNFFDQQCHFYGLRIIRFCKALRCFNSGDFLGCVAYKIFAVFYRFK
ncbi:hypothetical protein EV695_2082 [Cocleimonas flava]|uniref:Uncharacterized protein n=1 Tax=Cocleimonas flava TaxID=634765 RepID=A0A4R1F2C4_9GAMM|nr:hypothetical protein EV695_2082 [Cocleimonas flava]